MKKYLLLLVILLAGCTNIRDENLRGSIIYPQYGGTGTSTAPSYGQILIGNANGTYTLVASSTLGGAGVGSGTVTSVDMSVPTGLTIGGNPITTSGTLALTLTSGYNIPLTASTSNWDTAYNWGNHAGLYDVLGQATSTKDWLLSQPNSWSSLQTFSSASTTGILTINQICNSAGECFDSPDVEGSAITFYPNNDASDIATYENMFIIPTIGVSIDESCAADSDVAGGYCLIDSYVSSSTDQVILNYPAGTTKIHSYTYVDSAVGTSNLVFRGYRRDASGNEYYLGEATTTEINNLTIQEFQSNFVGATDTAFNVNGTDRLVMKVYGYTTSNTAKTIHWTYQSSGLYSHLITPITRSDVGHARIYANETITGVWTFNKTNITYASSTGMTADSFWGALIGNASTASALAADPSDCAAGTCATAIAANGNLTCSITPLVSTSIDTIAKLNTILTGEDVASTTTAMTALSDSTWTLHNSYPAACGANQFVTTLGDTNTCSAVADITCTDCLNATEIEDIYLLDDGDVGTGNYDFGGANFFEIPNGTAPTADDVGELAHDTTDNQLILDDYVIPTTFKIWSATVASTSRAFIDAGLLPFPQQLDGYTITRISCYTSGGTSKVIAVEDASANSSEDITCDADGATDDGSITNATYTSSELGNIDFGATSGAVNYVSISVFGIWARE